jgi:hypothetical protein
LLPPPFFPLTLCTQHFELDLELELIQIQMAQKPLLWVEAGAHAVQKKKGPERGWAEGASMGAMRRLCVLHVCVLSLKPLGLFGAASILCVAPARSNGLCAKHRWFSSVRCNVQGARAPRSSNGFQIIDCLLVCLHWRWHWRWRWPSAL